MNEQISKVPEQTAGAKPIYAKYPRFPQASSGIFLVKAKPEILAELNGIIDFMFPRPVADYVAMDAQTFRQIVVNAQHEINRRNMADWVANCCENMLPRILSSAGICREPARLRAVRPNVANKQQEAINYHRESFYNPIGLYAVNIWMPIRNVCADSALQYIWDSHLIPDDAIERRQVLVDETVTCGSSGSLLGLVDQEFRIAEGVDFSDPRPLVVLPGEIALFSGSLIHGVGYNYYPDRIRFSIDFRVFPEELYPIVAQQPT
jgi:hypothetical protein